MAIDFLAGAPVAGELDIDWIHGSLPRGTPTDPPVQVHWFDPHTAILRQSKDATFEAPFIFLLFGNDRALLLDSGATKDTAVREAVDRSVRHWLHRNPREDYSLVVAHTHGHGDHVAGDASFAGRPHTTVVGRDPAAVQRFFGFTSWPAEELGYDLGGRVLDITGIPGHQPASIAVYDRWTGLLLTGDSVLPGRIYVADMPAFVDSMARLGHFASTRPVTHVLGCHVEMSVDAGHDYFPGCRYQPREVRPQMPADRVGEVRDAAQRVAQRKGVHRFDNFVIYNGMGPVAAIRLGTRGLAGQLRGLLRPYR